MFLRSFCLGSLLLATPAILMAQANPVIKVITENSQGTEITITGEDWGTQQPQVLLGGVQLTLHSFTTTSIVANLPKNIAAGTYLLDIHNSATGAGGSRMAVIGNVGPVGPMGLPGSAGAPGASGATGPAGAPGAPGAIGPAGAAGTPGAIGPAGAPGAPGAIGPAGAPGTPGAIGPAGAPGAPGAIGPAGAAGTPGATGPAGAPGTPGAIGPAGAPGTPGATGPAGAPGAPGATGPAGAPGTPGATGPAGAPGTPGATGPAGTPGAAGPTGPEGPGGPAGQPGPAGPAGSGVSAATYIASFTNPGTSAGSPYSISPIITAYGTDISNIGNQPNFVASPVACTVSALNVGVNNYQSSGPDTTTITVYKNGNPTSMTCSASTNGGKGGCSDTTDTFGVVQGDTLSLHFSETNVSPFNMVTVALVCQ
jgi:Collagen triple helix repeat (20 copies)/IPT/TIG domain